jgi:hypothetical protein
MLVAILIVIVVLWLLATAPSVHILIPSLTLFSINGHPVTLWNVLVLGAVVWALKFLPEPIKQIVFILLVLWILSVVGIFAFGGFFHILILVIVIWLVLSLIGVLG